MSKTAKDFIAGILLGFLTIIFAYMILEALVHIKVSSSDSKVNLVNAVIIILAYGVGNALLGHVLNLFGNKK